APFELGLVVPRIDVTGPAVHEQPDDRFGLGRKMGWPRRQRVDVIAVGVRGHDGLGSETLLFQQRRNRQHPCSMAGTGQEFATRRVGWKWGSEERGRVHRVTRSTAACTNRAAGYSTYTNSFKHKSTWQKSARARSRGAGFPAV